MKLSSVSLHPCENFYFHGLCYGCHNICHFSPQFVHFLCQNFRLFKCSKKENSKSLSVFRFSQKYLKAEKHSNKKSIHPSVWNTFHSKKILSNLLSFSAEFISTKVFLRFIRLAQMLCEQILKQKRM